MGGARRQPKFILSHLDGFYSNSILETFLRGIACAIRSRQIEPNTLELHFVNGEPEHSLIESLNLQSQVVYAHLASSHHAKMNYLSRSTAILFVQRGLCNGYVPERFFELLTLRRKVLALVPNPSIYVDYASEIDDIVLAGTSSQKAMTHVFLQMYQKWRANPSNDALHRPCFFAQDWRLRMVGPRERVIHLAPKSAA